MLTLRSIPRRSNCPISMVLPACSTGGAASISLTRSSPLDLFQKPRCARMCPTTRTWVVAPRRI